MSFTRRRDPQERFWEKVDRSGDCWLWLGAVDPTGVGRFNLDGHRSAPTTRVAWLFEYGKEPEGFIYHTCEEKRCIRPSHLTVRAVSGKPARELHEFIDVRSWGECWEWTGTKTQLGYGYTHYRGRRERAHRVVWEEYCGPIPEGMVVMHLCDNPPCCNPAHLQPGTHAENKADSVRKGRGRNAYLVARLGKVKPGRIRFEEQSA